MMCKKAATLIFSCSVLIALGDGAVTKEQMDQAAGLIRQSCMGKVKISEAQAEEIKRGNIPDYKEGKCYIHCILEMTQAMKKSKVTLENFFKQVDALMPEEMREETKEIFTKCKDAGLGTKDPCEVATLMFKCFKEVTNGEREFV